MPILAHAKKALRVSRRKALDNQRIKSRVKTLVDGMEKAPSAQTLTEAFSAVDRAVKSGIFHKNKAARMKSRLSKLVSTK